MKPNIEIESNLAAGYLNLISQTMKDIKIPQPNDQKVPYDARLGARPT